MSTWRPHQGQGRHNTSTPDAGITPGRFTVRLRCATEESASSRGADVWSIKWSDRLVETRLMDGRSKRSRDVRAVPDSGSGVLPAVRATLVASDGFEANRRFRAPFDGSVARASLAPPDGVLIEGNEAFAPMLGCTCERLNGRTVDEIIQPDDRAAWQDYVSRAALAGRGAACAHAETVRPTFRGCVGRVERGRG